MRLDDCPQCGGRLHPDMSHTPTGLPLRDPRRMVCDFCRQAFNVWPPPGPLYPLAPNDPPSRWTRIAFLAVLVMWALIAIALVRWLT